MAILTNINSIKIWQVFTRLSLAFLCLSAHPITLYEGESFSPIINLNKKPIPGQDAFWAHNPKNPSQKILLVPSHHRLNSRFIRSDLMKQIKLMDVLITEFAIGAASWDDAEQIKEACAFKIEDLVKEGIIQDQPFEFSDSQFPDITGPWPAIIKQLDSSIALYVENLFEPYLKDISEDLKLRFGDIIPLQNVHPYIVSSALSSLLRLRTVNFFGMDYQIQRDFTLHNKEILALETIEELRQIQYGVINVLPYIKQIKINMKLLNDIITNSKQNIQYKGYFPKEVNDKNMKERAEDIKQLPWTEKEEEEKEKIADSGSRNKLWIPKLLDYFNSYSNNSFGIVVGAAHFPGPTSGLFKLLSDEGFTFTPFEQNATEVTIGARAMKVVEPQSAHHNKIVEAEQKKAKLGAVAYRVDEALNLLDTAIEVTENEQLKKSPKEIRLELINITAKIIALDGDTKENYYYTECIYNYIETRNKIFADTAIINKTKALEVLQQNPKFKIEEVKDALK